MLPTIWQPLICPLEELEFIFAVLCASWEYSGQMIEIEGSSFEVVWRSNCLMYTNLACGERGAVALWDSTILVRCKIAADVLRSMLYPSAAANSCMYCTYNFQPLLRDATMHPVGPRSRYCVEIRMAWDAQLVIPCQQSRSSGLLATSRCQIFSPSFCYQAAGSRSDVPSGGGTMNTLGYPLRNVALIMRVKFCLGRFSDRSWSATETSNCFLPAWHRYLLAYRDSRHPSTVRGSYCCSEHAKRVLKACQQHSDSKLPAPTLTLHLQSARNPHPFTRLSALLVG